MRPHVLINVAISADGKLSTRERRQVKISGRTDFERVDHLKASCDAVMVGIGTVLADDPSLTVKSADLIAERVRSGKPEHPVRIVIDSRGRLPPDAKILHKGLGKRIVAVTESVSPDRISVLSPYADIILAGSRQVDLEILLERLYEAGIRRLMVEGGGTLIWGLFSAGLVDEISTFVGNMIIGGKDAPTLADGEGFVTENHFPRLYLDSVTPLDEGVMIHWKVIK
ncbi:MAG: 2,5-diamino-6-(ribosylamino)-4(3H)-pyrimidinone 5'-phosphate reductase [Methanospirillum sp.]|nr:2,5-diamino-6-(ribosylamino)-4(3H)-pyrimidinone 5'-phosphate reductase [Methanospirillum sp.]